MKLDEAKQILNKNGYILKEETENKVNQVKIKMTFAASEISDYELEKIGSIDKITEDIVKFSNRWLADHYNDLTDRKDDLKNVEVECIDCDYETNKSGFVEGSYGADLGWGVKDQPDEPEYYEDCSWEGYAVFSIKSDKKFDAKDMLDAFYDFNYAPSELELVNISIV